MHCKQNSIRDNLAQVWAEKNIELLYLKTSYRQLLINNTAKNKVAFFYCYKTRYLRDSIYGHRMAQHCQLCTTTAVVLTLILLVHLDWNQSANRSAQHPWQQILTQSCSASIRQRPCLLSQSQQQLFKWEKVKRVKIMSISHFEGLQLAKRNIQKWFSKSYSDFGTALSCCGGNAGAGWQPQSNIEVFFQFVIGDHYRGMDDHQGSCKPPGTSRKLQDAPRCVKMSLGSPHWNHQGPIPEPFSLRRNGLFLVSLGGYSVWELLLQNN